MTVKEEVVIVPLKQYQELLKDSQWKQAFEAAGVDNWQGFDYAYELLEEMRKLNGR